MTTRPACDGPLRWPRFLVAPFVLASIVGCSPPTGPGTTDGSVPGASVLQANRDPLDPEGAILTDSARGVRLVFFGEKAADGTMSAVQALKFFASAADDAPAYTITLDDQGRVRTLAAASGEQIVLEYDDASQTATAYFHREGSVVEALALDFSAAPGAERAIASSRPGATDRVTIGANRSSETTRTIRFFVDLSLEGGGAATEDFATVPDAVVLATVLGEADAPPPGRYDRFQGAYLFDVASRLTDFDSQIADCDAELERFDRVMAMLEYTTGLLFTACTLSIVLQGGCHAFVAVGTYAAFTGLLGWDAGAQTRCETLRRHARDPSLGRVSVTVTASVPRLNWSESMTVQYDIRDDQDPITLAGRADVRFLIPVSCGPCPEPLICDGQRCVECVFPNDCADSPVCSPDGRCVDCIENLHCRSSVQGSFCVGNQCSGCTTAQQCQQAGLGAACADGACVECTVDEECINDPSRPACTANQCVQCSTDQHCAGRQAGPFCVDEVCRACRNDADCGVGVCDPVTHECVEGEPASEGFHVVAYANFDCVGETGPAGACGLTAPIDAGFANIQLSGDPNRPTITWPANAGVDTLLVTSGATSLYGIVGETPPDAEGNSDVAAFGFSSVAYGDYGLPNIAALLLPDDATSLVQGSLYSITIYTLDGRIATLTFEVAP